MNLNKFAQMSQKKKVTYLLLLFVMFSASFIYLIYFPSIKRINSLRKQIINQKIEVKKNMAYDRSVVELERNLKKIEPKLGILDSVFINQNRELEFITTLEGLAARNKVEQKIILNIDNSKNDQNYKIIPLVINLKGTYNNIVNYLIDLETMKYYINIDSITMSADKKITSSTDEAQFNFSINISATSYWK